jgi:hypothetical protein
MLRDMNARWSTVGFSLGIVALAAPAACGGGGGGGGGGAPIPEDQYGTKMAELVCRLTLSECDCDDPPFPDDATCREATESQWELMKDAAEQAGLDYDAACAGTNYEIWKNTGCDADLAFPSDCDAYCSIYHGSVEVGGGCTEYEAGLSDCASGLFCLEGVCETLCEGEILGEGEECIDLEQEEILGECDPAQDLVCETASGVCVGLPDVGEPCPDYECVEGAICDVTGEGLCIAGPGVGEPCQDFECGSGSTCDTGQDPPLCVAPEPFVCF